MPSAAVSKFDYLPDSRELVVTFITGRRYVYANVPEEVYRRFRSVMSKGGFFNRHIRGRYDYRQIEHED